MRKLTLEETEKHFKLGVEKATEFFGISQDVRIKVLNEACPEDCRGDMCWHAELLEAQIRLNIQYLSENPEEIWQIAGHEVAHIQGREFLALRDRHKELEKEFTKEFAAEYLTALEMLTTRLDRLFLRNVPDPLESLYG